MSDQVWKALDEVIADVVAPQAQPVDEQGAFPSEAVEALAEAGVLGATVPTAAGGMGFGLADAARIVDLLSQSCGSTAMVTMMHFAAVPVLAAHGPREIVDSIAAGRHLSTLAFSEAGSRSHFWAPVSTAAPAEDDRIVLDARKSWVTSAGHADSYVWSSRPLAADGPMTLWFVPAATTGVRVAGPFDGLGLRGNGSRPVHATQATIPRSAMLGADGTGLDLAMQLTLPWFLVLNAAFSVGLAEATVREAVSHLTTARLEHLDQTLADQPTVRRDIGLMRLHTDTARAMLSDTVTAVEAGRDEAGLRVLEVKAVAAETAIAVTDLAMKACGGAAFRKDLGIERRFRDARAARVMAPTTDQLTDFVARLSCGMPMLAGA
ncbi:acyl-CoA dehydrogenase family protein [Phytohabitans flavus]|uniref:Acyl-CoA dehydrogenase n=1 Tax=Phytohabitans flavus TaxID=1076124 RepID=A0A6F8Y0E9_9ACTN|nr:acyl-CoA dehydrogenase family protein [Phytohabitans flavus]BCB79592.1 acyl-CoA dehydrogenase [Phytohabitans flavus]